MRIRKAVLKEGTWVCYMRCCIAAQPLCSSLLICKHFCSCSDRLSKRLCESFLPREVNLFVQKGTGSNQLIHFCILLEETNALSISCHYPGFWPDFPGRTTWFYQGRSKLSIFFFRKGETRSVQTVDGRQSRSFLCGQLLTYHSSFKTEHHVSYCSNSDTPFNVFLPWQLFSL